MVMGGGRYTWVRVYDGMIGVEETRDRIERERERETRQEEREGSGQWTRGSEAQRGSRLVGGKH